MEMDFSSNPEQKNFIKKAGNAVKKVLPVAQKILPVAATFVPALAPAAAVATAIRL